MTQATTGGAVEHPAGERFSVALERTRRSIWRTFGLGRRLNFIGDASAEVVANQQGNAPDFLGSGGTIVVRDRSDGQVRFSVATSDLVGGTSPEQMLDDLHRDLAELSIARFAEKYGCSA